MKKLMIAAAIVSAVAISQAASFSWTSTADVYDSSGVKLVNTTSQIPADGKIVLVLLGNGDNASWDNFKAENVASEATSYKYLNNKGTWQYVVTGTAALTAGVNADGDKFTVGLLKDGELSHLLDYGTKEALDPIYTLSWNGSATAQGIATFTYATAPYQLGNVPEPTSAMLLLLGVAGLALRRKQK